eukprot:5519619-Pleurochrysis_carterae.AAC.2
MRASTVQVLSEAALNTAATRRPRNVFSCLRHVRTDNAASRLYSAVLLYPCSSTPFMRERSTFCAEFVWNECTLERVVAGDRVDAAALERAEVPRFA